MTHNHILSLGLESYVENIQYDAQECLSFILNVFYPWIDNGLRSGCLFLLEGEETILCNNCNRYANKDFKETLCPVAFPQPDVETSIKSKIEQMVSNTYGEQMDSLYACEYCEPIRTIATQGRTLLNIEKYIIIQLKVFGYDEDTGRSFKIVPNLIIEEKFINVLLETLSLCAIGLLSLLVARS